MQKPPAYILPLIILSQFAGTSLWFAGNAVLPVLRNDLNLANTGLGNLASVVQFGFIAGTLVFAIFSVADRFHSSKVFFVSSFLAALANLLIIWFASDTTALYILRFITGFFLAGIYPVGMKIASDWYEKGLGKALGYLVGALVVGTALPHLLRSDFFALPWKQTLIVTSVIAFLGGLVVFLFIPNGPFKKMGSRFQPSAFIRIFESADFRAASFGYFGHMWELYAFWTFVPVLLGNYLLRHQLTNNAHLWAFIVIATGAFSCVAGGYLSKKSGSSRVAFAALLLSGICCLLSVRLFDFTWPLFIMVMIVWGITVVADSPQFSALVAQTAIPEYKGTALTIVTCIGFSITIASIQLIESVFDKLDYRSFVLLAFGPLFGLLFLYRLVRQKM